MELSFLSVGSGWRSLVQQLIAAGVVTCRVRVQERGPKMAGPAQLVEPQICIVIAIGLDVIANLGYRLYVICHWFGSTVIGCYRLSQQGLDETTLGSLGPLGIQVDQAKHVWIHHPSILSVFEAGAGEERRQGIRQGRRDGKDRWSVPSVNFWWDNGSLRSYPVPSLLPGVLGYPLVN